MTNETRQERFRSRVRRALEENGARGVTDAQVREFDSATDGDDVWNVFEAFAGDWGEGFDWDAALEAVERTVETF